MELAEYSVFAEKCFRDTPPPCAAVCPLAYDVREFIRLMRKGSLRSAYKLIRSSLIFPSVITRLCPETCRKACVRGRMEGEESIYLRHLEQICVDKMSGKDPERYNIPQKAQHVVVIGAGLSSAACAYRLASFGYQVRVYESVSLAGGTLPAGIDRQWVHDEIMREFKAVKCEFIFDHEIATLAGLLEDMPECDEAGSKIPVDAVYIATGEGGLGFEGQESEHFPGMVVRGGALTGTGLMESVRSGLSAAEMINNELLTDRSSEHIDITVTAPERQVDERYYSLNYDTSMPDEIPEKSDAEAFRCMRCNCSECYDVCPLMDKHKLYPKKICNEIIITLKPQKSKRSAVRLIMGCTECGLCRDACPENIDMGKCILEARSDFYESGAMSPAFHDYWIQDMEFCESDEARLLHIKNTNLPADVLFFPGCQLSASLPEYTIRAYESLAGVCDNPAVLLGCCGVPAKWAGLRNEYDSVRKRLIEDWESLGRPLVVTSCPSCLESMKDLHPDMKITSYYHFASDHPEMTGPVKGTGTVRVLDPCSSVSEPEMAGDVRKLLASAGYEVVNEDAEPGCCGFGGHIYNAARPTYEKFAKHRTADTDGIIATYCANCRDIFAAEGADSRHVLGMILGIDEEKRTPPELSDRRLNRRFVKASLSGENVIIDKKDQMNNKDIYISEEIVRLMDKELILREQVEELICYAEETNNKLYDEEDNVFIAHKRFGTITIWVRYRYENDALVVENVYYHRMDIREEQR